jgi:hypothetical protein
MLQLAEGQVVCSAYALLPLTPVNRCLLAGIMPVHHGEAA